MDTRWIERHGVNCYFCHADLLEACKIGRDACAWMADAPDADPEDYERLAIVEQAIHKAEERMR